MMGLLQILSLTVLCYRSEEILPKLEHSIFGKNEAGFLKHKLT